MTKQRWQFWGTDCARVSYPRVESFQN